LLTILRETTFCEWELAGWLPLVGVELSLPSWSRSLAVRGAPLPLRVPSHAAPSRRRAAQNSASSEKLMMPSLPLRCCSFAVICRTTSRLPLRARATRPRDHRRDVSRAALTDAPRASPQVWPSQVAVQVPQEARAGVLGQQDERDAKKAEGCVASRRERSTPLPHARFTLTSRSPHARLGMCTLNACGTVSCPALTEHMAPRSQGMPPWPTSLRHRPRANTLAPTPSRQSPHANAPVQSRIFRIV
jgi:hypothetical protein